MKPLDLDTEVMVFKLHLRSLSKPGEDLWELDELYDNNDEMEGWVLQSSGKEDNTYTVSYPIAIIDTLPILAYFKIFDDEGEWELELEEITQ